LNEKKKRLALPALYDVALHSVRGSFGLSASTDEVGFLVGASGVPFKDGLAHRAPEEIPIKRYSAWAF